MAKLKVVHVIPYLLVGGADRLFTDLVIFLDKAKFENIVLLCGKTGSFLEKELKERGYKIYLFALLIICYSQNAKISSEHSTKCFAQSFRHTKNHSSSLIVSTYTCKGSYDP